MQMNSTVQAAFSKLGKTEQKALKREYGRRCKNVTTGFLAWGLLGWHYLYFGRVGMQFAFWCTGGFLIVGWILDLFRIRGMVRRHNETVSSELITQHRLLNR